ncbi:hypothetical protein Ocin01_07296 [Orchesella cincta]|uniref:Uncharacterized protein n=1 Tax=Orchesella cincta TaxID=48709 RepID=A0A1D2N2A3_ORCCI|nr:hypothetical protein Ocin01_07296 [Orchesella cincta]
MSILNQYLFLVVLLQTAALLLASSGATDSATIRAIESELRRVKSTSETIAADIKKQKDSTAILQNEFKWLHNELKGLKKSLADIEQLVNKTISSDTQFIREKMMELSTFILNANKNSTKASNITATTPSPTKKTFKLF